MLNKGESDADLWGTKFPFLLDTFEITWEKHGKTRKKLKENLQSIENSVKNEQRQRKSQTKRQQKAQTFVFAIQLDWGFICSRHS